MVTGFIDAAASPLRDTGRSIGASSSDGAPRDAGRFDAALDARLDRAPHEPRARTSGSRREGWPPVAATNIETTRAASVDARATGRTPLPGESGWKAAGSELTDEAVAADGDASTAAVAEGSLAMALVGVPPPEVTPELLAAGAFTPQPVTASGNGNTGGEAGGGAGGGAGTVTPTPTTRAATAGVAGGHVASPELPAGGPEGLEQVPGAAAALAALAGPGVSQTPPAETSTPVGEPASAARAAEPVAARGPAGNAARLATELVQNTASTPADAVPVELTTSEQLVAVPVAVARGGAERPDSAGPARAAVEGDVSAAVASGLAAQEEFAGDDASSQGDERRSPQYARLAAALAFASPSRVDDGGRPAVSFAVPHTDATGAVTSSAAVVAAAPAPGLTTAEDAENVARLVQTMRVFGRPGAWEATVRLKPEHMGEVTINLRVERNVVSAVVEADSASVRQWLESQEQSVRSGLAAHGLQLDRFVVHRDGQRGETHEAPEQESRRRSPRRAPVETERFEVMV